MDQHPIPQNITGFEFKLIGDMTVKQFAYLAGSIVIAYLTFITPLHPILKFPFIIFLVLLGIGLAFIPVEGRPLDRWIANFIRALFAPSQYIFHKEGAVPEFLNLKAAQPKPIKTIVRESTARARGERFSDYLQTIAPKATSFDEEEQARIAHIQKLTEEFAVPAQEPLQQDLKTPVLSGYSVPLPTVSNYAAHDEDLQKKLAEERKLEEEQKRVRQENEALKQELETARKTLVGSQISPPQSPPQAQGGSMTEALSIEKKLQEALSEKERLTSELSNLKSTLSVKAARESVVPTLATAPKASEKVKIIPPELSRAAGTAGLPHMPNLVCGIVKDGRGDVLPGIIVEVKDASTTPVRAFKTSKLGQFSASTSLANGKYTIELEDPRNTYIFDIIAIELNGSNFSPLEIIAKNPVSNERQMLYQSLFGARQN